MSGFTINTATVTGNLTRDPELRSLPSGTSVCSLRLAFNERVKNRDTSDWDDRANYISVTIWSGMGEWVANKLKKGDGITVSGRLRWREWETDQGGKREALEIVAESIVPRDGSSSGGGGGSGGNREREDPTDQPPARTGAEEEIPF